MTSFETEILDKQLEGVKWVCFADGPGSHCECPQCEKAERESMEYALQSYVPKSTPVEDNECDCGGEFDEDDKCDSCSNGHDDCEAQECFACFERAVDRAERMAEGDER